ncbi:MAG: hypothetical protein WC794_04620 [Candidatus Doudnabacteria bacterium]|jgi:hypothetical protein
MKIKRFQTVDACMKLGMFSLGLLLTFLPVRYGQLHQQSFWQITENVLITSLIGFALAEVGNQTYRRLFRGGLPDKHVSGIISPTLYDKAGRKLLWLFMTGLVTSLVTFQAILLVF